MTIESVLSALLNIWDELPKLIGEDWQNFYSKLKKLITRLQMEADEGERALLVAKIVTEFRPYTNAKQRLRECIQKTDHYRENLRNFGIGTPISEISDFYTVLNSLQEKLTGIELQYTEQQFNFVPPKAKRYVNVYFLRPTPPKNLYDGEDVVQKNTSLETNKQYYLCINLGPLSSHSVVTNAEKNPFPDDLLPATETGHWLEVVVVSDDLVLSKHRYDLFLPNIGESWVCNCPPKTEHTCTSTERSNNLLIPIIPPKQIQTARLRIGIYYEKNLLQSQLLTVEITETETEGLGYSSYVDYSLTANLENIGNLPQCKLNILTNINTDGTHKIVINGKSDDAVHFKLSEGQIRNAINAVRQQLLAIHIETSENFFGNISRRNLYDHNNSKTKEHFIDDLKNLALLGWQLWTMLLADKPELQCTLPKVLMKDPTPIQVSRVSGSSFVFPWSMLYDIPLSTYGPHSLCRLLKEWDNAANLINELSPCCPYNESHTMDVICPFGFWGFKHTIEQPPSIPKTRSLPFLIKSSNQPPKLVLGFSQDLIEDLTNNHLRSMGNRLTDFSIIPQNSRAGFIETIKEPKLEIIYLYCHGRRQTLPGSSEPTPFLEIGKGERFSPSDVTAWRVSSWDDQHWQETSPLIFINGCHTAELTPESLINFVDVFLGAYASGVIGTEIALHQQVANEAAEEFFNCFQYKKDVGTSLKYVSRYFLLKNNLLGLAYTPYCSANLRLS